MRLLFDLKKMLFKSYLLIPINRFLFQVIKSRFIPPYRIRKYLRFKGPFTLKLDANSRVRIMNYGNTIENELFWLGTKGWEPKALDLWMTLCKRSSVIFDVGANTGLYSLVSGKLNPSAEIYAFEPLPVIYSRLQHNLKINGLKASMHLIALTDEDGEAKIFSANTLSDTFDQASLNQSRIANGKYTIIKTKKLSTFIEDNAISNIDLIKIDVETFEAHVLRGMGKYLELFRPTMLIEILNAGIGREVFEMIKSFGYRYYRIDEKKGYSCQSNLTPSSPKGNNFLLLNPVKHPDLIF
jgi:FkbM family methyltransferase